MNGQTHFVGGLASLWLVPFPPTAPVILAAWAGAWAPDLDSYYNSLAAISFTIKRRRSPALCIHPLRPLSFAVHTLFGHRGVIHSLVGLVASTAIVAILTAHFGGSIGIPFAFAAGYLSHLLLDCCTVMGLKILRPKKKTYHFLPRGFRVTTNSTAEDAFFIPLAILAFTYVITVLFLMRTP